ncbi:MAG: D-alanyl-D-alanine carboxypeptidase family protein [Chitinophagales bacterium]
MRVFARFTTWPPPRRSARLAMVLLLLAFVLAFPALGALAQAPAGGGGFDIPAPSGILVEATSGQVLWSKNPDEPRPPASITKIMQLLLVMEAVDSGKIKLTDKVTASHRAATFGGSSMWVKEGEQFTVDDLLKAVSVASANDGSVMLAEYLAGSEEAFVDRMNERARELGLTHTYFMNSMGLPAIKGQQGNRTTAREIAIMAQELLKHKRILNYTSIRHWEIRGGKNKFDNTNHLLGRYPGVDGLKTGHTEEAGWSLVATAKRGGTRLIAVVLDAGSEEARVTQAGAELDYGFRNFVRQPVVRKGEEVASFTVPRGGRPVVAVAAAELAVLALRGQKAAAEATFVRRPNLTPPIKAGQVVGEVRLRMPGVKLSGSVPAVAREEVKRANQIVSFLQAIWRAFVHVITLGRR